MHNSKFVYGIDCQMLKIRTVQSTITTTTTERRNGDSMIVIAYGYEYR